MLSFSNAKRAASCSSSACRFAFFARLFAPAFAQILAPAYSRFGAIAKGTEEILMTGSYEGLLMVSFEYPAIFTEVERAKRAGRVIGAAAARLAPAETCGRGEGEREACERAWRQSTVRSGAATRKAEAAPTLASRTKSVRVMPPMEAGSRP